MADRVRHNVSRRSRAAHLGLVVLAAALCVSAAAPAYSLIEPGTTEAPSLTATPPELTSAAIQARLKALEAGKDLDEAQKTALIDIYNKILQQLKQGDELAERAEAFEKEATNAPDLAAELKRQLAKPPADDPPEIDPSQTLAQLQQGLTQAENRLAERQKRLTDLQNEPKRRADRRAEIPRLQEAARKQLDEIQKQLAGKAPADDAPESVHANRLLLLARERMIERELSEFEHELALFDGTAELVALQRDQAVVQVAQAEHLVKLWQAAVTERRRADVERQAIAAQRAAVQAHPAIKQVASDNAALADERQTVAGQLEQVIAQITETEQQTHKLTDQYTKITERARRAGLNETIGLLLRKHRENLPNLREHRRLLENRQAEIANLTTSLLEREDERAELADIDAIVRKRVESIDDRVNRTELPLVEEELRQLLTKQREYLDALISDQRSYLDKLAEFETQERQLIAHAEEFQNYSDERILWIRSTSAPVVADFPRLVEGLRWLIEIDHWSYLGELLRADFALRPWMYVGFGLLCGALVVGQHFGRQRLRNWSADAARRFSTSFAPTAAALILTVLMAAAWPAMLALVGWRLIDLGYESEFTTALGRALLGVAALLFSLLLAKLIARPQGLGEAHFDWPVATLKIVRRAVRWLTWLGLPAAFVVALTESQSIELWKSTLGRLAFVISQMLLAWCAHRIWQAPRGILKELMSPDADSWWRRFEGFWRLATVGGPLILASLALAGYYYTAVQLAWWLICTNWLFAGLIVLHATMLRWVLLAYRELAIRRARERRNAEAAAAAAAASTEGKVSVTETVVVEPAVSLADVNLQTRNLLRLVTFGMLFAGTWLIWAGVLPALGVFGRVEIWPETFSILTEADAPRAGEVVTLANVILAALAAMLTFAASRNLPGLLEITVLRQLSLDAGVRYAVLAISRYVIMLVGFLIAFGELGIGWSQVQWLIAGISVGLGFGLQEIFANFVSGLILLFERPIRVGDVVSVGDVTGKVSQIRIRATTITDGELRQLVVPNKELITGKVINWTLNDTISRMTIRIVVAHDSNPDEVRQILLRVAREHPLVISEPAPHALLDDVVDNSLVFILRVFMANLDVGVQVRHELYTQIVAALKEASITIAYPQRDLHVRTLPETVTGSPGSGSHESNGHPGERADRPQEAGTGAGERGD